MIKYFKIKITFKLYKTLRYFKIEYIKKKFKEILIDKFKQKYDKIFYY